MLRQAEVSKMTEADDGDEAAGGKAAASTSAAHKLVYVVLKAAVQGEDDELAAASVASLRSMADEVPLVVAQIWLDQFARINGGASAAEYSSKDRVSMLRVLQQLIETIIDAMSRAADPVSVKACTGRMVGMASEEMTKNGDIVPQIQQPCSDVLVAISKRHLDKVMDTLLLKFQPSQVPHVFTVSTLGALTRARPMEAVPYLKGVLETAVANIRSVRKDRLREAYAQATASFCDAVLCYQSGFSKGIPPDATLARENFQTEADFMHEFIFSHWLSVRDPNVKGPVLDALGRLSHLVTSERLLKSCCQLIFSLTSSYKKSTEPVRVTRCLAEVIDAALKVDAEALEPAVDNIQAALIRQVSSVAR